MTKRPATEHDFYMALTLIAVASLITGLWIMATVIWFT